MNEIINLNKNTTFEIEDIWEVLSNPPSTKSADDKEEETKCARVLAWLKDHGVNSADPQSIIQNEEDKHKRNIAQIQHFLVQKPNINRKMKNFSSLKININFNVSQ